VGTAAYVIWILWLFIWPMIMGTQKVIAGSVPAALGEGPVWKPLLVTIDPGDKGTLVSAALFNTLGALGFQTGDRRIQFVSLLDDLVISLLIMGLVFMARQFLVDVIDGTPFTFENARRLKWIGLFLLAIGVVKPVIDNVAAGWTLSIVKIQSPALGPPFDVFAINFFNFGWILVSLFILILSASFRYGVELEKEHTLTV
jgi:hypothetical protein